MIQKRKMKMVQKIHQSLVVLLVHNFRDYHYNHDQDTVMVDLLTNFCFRVLDDDDKENTDCVVFVGDEILTYSR
ncbi:hypothetical protein FRACYDRAFT_269303 [Fragilariopsis cylindrus CCMP1102]|uniref:Uncharacterized protein n=1 Tax=Fragilariopsis cylindrus CCMP1102 TaxID=635003 RepID=A0A1E7FAW5_9STRA|nr:hypothetical protein FRACYDRAFT_269303 [Fragilariopsis cylindrus CCMP1102]|eukprot:OEU15286.1 hypothetical protein FRACYDRAFT_269303 [Fragilariopsis cylindrus CCMP1102]